jgi:hypothetical protein
MSDPFEAGPDPFEGDGCGRRILDDETATSCNSPGWPRPSACGCRTDWLDNLRRCAALPDASGAVSHFGRLYGGRNPDPDFVADRLSGDHKTCSGCSLAPPWQKWKSGKASLSAKKNEVPESI